MMEIVPTYYYKFKCLADRCRHSCCIGWEIEIDEAAMEFYHSLDTPLGERIRKSVEGNPPHFILTAGERCPFLRENGLCDMICEQGEEALCEICTLHPRFRNFYESFFETGLGLCCEEVARIVLSETEPFSIAPPENAELLEEERLFFAVRQKIFSVLQNREKSMGERLSCLAEEYGVPFDFSLEKLRKQYLALERLDDHWTTELESLQSFVFDGKIFEEERFQIPMEQLAVYFVFRHLHGAIWDGSYGERVGFVLKSCYFIGAIFARYQELGGEITMDIMTDLVRMYSAEVEYSEENMEALLKE